MLKFLQNYFLTPNGAFGLRISKPQSLICKFWQYLCPNNRFHMYSHHMLCPTRPLRNTIKNASSTKRLLQRCSLLWLNCRRWSNGCCVIFFRYINVGWAQLGELVGESSGSLGPSGKMRDGRQSAPTHRGRNSPTEGKLTLWGRNSPTEE